MAPTVVVNTKDSGAPYRVARVKTSTTKARCQRLKSVERFGTYLLNYSISGVTAPHQEMVTSAAGNRHSLAIESEPPLSPTLSLGNDCAPPLMG